MYFFLCKHLINHFTSKIIFVCEYNVCLVIKLAKKLSHASSFNRVNELSHTS